tara:strand:+ start:48 stop:236 length:189 start_codon:yes stop_codon:yes gene_type:complete
MKRKIIILIIIFFINACGYPDIDSVPNFEDIKLTDQEAIDLCKISNTDIKDINKCIDKINNK